jgi:hypothetical protein
MPPITKTIRPGAELDFVVDWNAPPSEKGPWLAAGETITLHNVTLEGPLSKLSDDEADGEVTVWVRCDPAAQIGEWAWVRVAIVTSAGRKDSRSIKLAVTSD